MEFKSHLSFMNHLQMEKLFNKKYPEKFTHIYKFNTILFESIVCHKKYLYQVTQFEFPKKLQITTLSNT